MRVLEAGFNATIERTGDDGDDDDDDEREASAILHIVLAVSAAGVVIALTVFLTLYAVHHCQSRYACTLHVRARTHLAIPEVQTHFRRYIHKKIMSKQKCLSLKIERDQV